MYESKDGEVDRQFFLGKSARRSQPRAKPGPKAFHRVDVDLVNAITVVVASILFLPTIDREMFVAPFLQLRIDVVLVGVDRGAQSM